MSPDDSRTLSGAERRALSTFLGLLSAHLKTWEMGEYLSQEKAQEMAQTAAWSSRLGDREWFLRPGEEWPAALPFGRLTAYPG